MNAEIFSEWLRRQGYIVVKTESSYWYDAWPRVFQAYPYHWVIQPEQAEINALLRVELRVASGRDPEPSAAIIDSQSVKTTEKGGLVDMTPASASRDEKGTSLSTRWA